MIEDRTYLAVTFEENQMVKNLGAKFDPDRRAWYINQFHDHAVFRDWIVSQPGTQQTQTPGTDKWCDIHGFVNIAEQVAMAKQAYKDRVDREMQEWLHRNVI
jgi:hypothetical protein